MRIPLVPLATVILGLAVIVSPPILPLTADMAVFSPDTDEESARRTASFYIHLAGYAITMTGLALFGRHHLFAKDPPPGRLQRRIFTGVAGFFIVLAILSAALVAALTNPAHAISLGEMAEEAGEDLELLPFFISVIFYILGLVIAGFGLLRLKRHVDHPSQTTLASGIVALAIGAALIATPSIIDAIGETFDIDSGATLERPDFD